MVAPARAGRRRRAEDTGGSWLTTYGDMVTLLMCFFVLLYAMSSVDIAKFQAFVSGLAVPFGNNAGEGLLPESTGLSPEVSPSIVPPDEYAPDLTEILEREAAEVAAMDRLDEVQAALDAALAEAGLTELVEQRREERGLVVSVASDDVLFALGSTEISSVGAKVIATVSTTLDGFANEVMVEGHTDDLPLRRGSYTNWNLSTDRAVAVVSRMIDRHRFPSTRLGAVGYGEYRPLVENRGSSSRARNRRVDFVVLPDEHLLETTP
jgi:chemotaxis protein MotB